ncbi:serpin family protein [Sedimentibacter sp.]|uniref:serpin family protein n=1 Tax=Sedimentibacter sp. TaxID=1960295 RepID=UPI0028AA5C50|nr:serpin family protein [Sedimentibacter sp.]
MRFKLAFILCLLFITMIIFTGCSYSDDLMKGINSNNEKGMSQPMDSKLNQAILDFTWKMFKDSSNNEGNIMISPPSVYFALAMTANGADGETKEEMLKALSAENIALDDLNKGLYGWVNAINRGEAVKLSIANSIWYRDDFKANEDFLHTNADYYSAAIQKLDFSRTSAVDTINKWVKDATNDKIDKIVEKIEDDVVMYLINAIYFKGDWKYQFSANDTREGDFNSPDKTVKTEYMSRRGDIDYLQLNGITGVLLPYIDEQFAFIGLLPEKGTTPRELVNNLSALDLINLMKNKKEKNIELLLPKFESKYEDSLIDELYNLGMNTPFISGSADFSKMNESGEKNLFISEVKHKTYVKVDEKGTEAAAATSVEVRLTGMPMEIPKLTFDRPFVYGIVDVTTGIPLFIGIMEDPTIK